MLSDLWHFVIAVCKHWGPLASGGAALVIMQGAEYAFKQNVPVWVIWTLIAASVFVSCFLAWRDEHKNTQALTFQLKNRRAVDSLAELRARAINNLFTARIKTEQEFIAWKERQESWCHDVSQVLRDNFTKAELLAFQNLGSLTDKSFLHAHNELHRQQLLFLDARLKVLRDIINAIKS